MGATLVLDSRYISGLSDGNAIGSWPDKSGNAYDPTQAIAAAKPTYKTAIQGGNPVARFDGGDSLYKNQNLSTVNALTYVITCSFTSNVSRNMVFDAKNYQGAGFASHGLEQNTYNTVGQRYGHYTSSGAHDSDTATSSGMKIISAAANTTSGNNVVNNTTYRVQGNTSALNSRSGTLYANLSNVNGFMVGAFNNGGNAAFVFHNGDIAQIIVLPSNTTGAPMKRMEHAAAYSFKIACS